MTSHPFVQAFATVFPAELPDKTMVATIILTTRFRRPLAVWGGAVSAFALHVAVAVVAGKALSLLPHTPVQIFVAGLFAIGAVVLFRTARSHDGGDPAELAAGASTEPDATVTRTVAGSFGLILLAEWGDLTQLATMSLAAKSGSAVATGLGAWIALAIVAAIAATSGRQLVARVPLRKINYIGAAVFAALSVWTIVELAT